MALVRLALLLVWAALLLAIVGAVGFATGFALRGLFPRSWRVPVSVIGFLAIPFGIYEAFAVHDRGNGMDKLAGVSVAAQIGFPMGIGWVLAIGGAFSKRPPSSAS